MNDAPAAANRSGRSRGTRRWRTPAPCRNRNTRAQQLLRERGGYRIESSSGMSPQKQKVVQGRIDSRRASGGWDRQPLRARFRAVKLFLAPVDCAKQAALATIG